MLQYGEILSCDYRLHIKDGALICAVVFVAITEVGSNLSYKKKSYQIKTGIKLIWYMWGDLGNVLDVSARKQTASITSAAACLYFNCYLGSIQNIGYVA